MIQGTLPEFLRAQLADLHRQETRAREAKWALLRVYLAGGGHDLDALDADVIDLDTGAYAFRPTEAQREPGGP